MGPGLIPRPLAIAITIVITGVWAASQLGSLFVPGYTAPDAIHAALMIVLGTVFALRRTDEPSKDPSPAAVAPIEQPPPAAPPRTPEPVAPPGSVPAADLIARLRAERDRDQR